MWGRTSRTLAKGTSGRILDPHGLPAGVGQVGRGGVACAVGPASVISPPKAAAAGFGLDFPAGRQYNLLLWESSDFRLLWLPPSVYYTGAASHLTPPITLKAARRLRVCWV